MVLLEQNDTLKDKLCYCFPLLKLDFDARRAPEGTLGRPKQVQKKKLPELEKYGLALLKEFQVFCFKTIE